MFIFYSINDKLVFSAFFRTLTSSVALSMLKAAISISFRLTVCQIPVCDFFLQSGFLVYVASFCIAVKIMNRPVVLRWEGGQRYKHIKPFTAPKYRF